MKYHISKDGVPRVCRAKGVCPLGSPEEHFETEAEAKVYAESKLKGKHGILPSVESTEKEKKSRVRSMNAISRSMEGDNFANEYLMDTRDAYIKGTLSDRRLISKLRTVQDYLEGNSYSYDLLDDMIDEINK